MTFSMSGLEGGWDYNRFDLYEKKGKKEDCPKCEGACHCDEPVNEAMDPVGKEDGDVNNDGKKDSSDKYLMKRRAAIAKAMKKEEVMAEGDFPKDAPSIKDAKPAKKTDVKYDSHMKVMAPQVNKEEVELEEGSCGSKGYQEGGVVGYQKGGEVKSNKKDKKMSVYKSMKEAYAEMYGVEEGYKKFPHAKVQDQAAMKPDTAKGEKQARKLDTVRKATKMFPGEVKDMVKGREMDNKKKGLERRFNAPSADGAETKKMKNKAYKLENQRRQDLNKRYGPKKEEFEAWLSELPDEVTIFTEEELFNIFESRLEE